MGPCKVCQLPGCFGFQPPGFRKDRRAHWVAWACTDHRQEVEVQWAEHINAHLADREAGDTQEREHVEASDSELSGGASDAIQGTLI